MVEKEVNKICEKINNGLNQEELAKEFCKVCKILKRLI